MPNEEERLSRLENTIYQGTYGKASVLEKLQNIEGKISKIEGEVLKDTTNRDRRINENRLDVKRLEEEKLDTGWVKILLSAISIFITATGILAGILTNLPSPDKERDNRKEGMFVSTQEIQ